MKQLKFVLTVFMIYAALMTGCSAFRFESPSSRNGQIAISTLLALDTAQTITIARSPDSCNCGWDEFKTLAGGN